MLAKILRLYTAAMAGDVRSPLIHLVGPPGCGKSTSVEKAAELLGVNLHVINVSRLSPLEIEGVQMPVEENTRLHMLTATFWTQIKEGDIVLFDEFLRGFPEVYNGLLDIMTSRQVGPYKIAKAFFIGASNSTAAYDKALEDRLLHVRVADPRRDITARKNLAALLIEGIGLHPDMAAHYSMEALLETEVLPTFNMLDLFDGKPNVSAASIKGKSVRNLIGQARLRQVMSSSLKELLLCNNRIALDHGACQYVVLMDGRGADPAYLTRARKLIGNPKLTELQAQNLELNLQLVEMEEAMSEIEEDVPNEPVF